MKGGSGAGSPVVAAAARALGLDMWTTFVGAVPGSWVRREGDVAAFDSGTQIARFNAVSAPVADADPDTVVQLTEALAARRAEISLHLPVPCSPRLRELADQWGLAEEQEPLMLLDDPTTLVAAATASDAEVIRLRPGEIARHVDVWSRGFGVSPQALGPWLASDLLRLPNVVAFQATVAGVDVATSLGIVAQGFVGVFNVACVDAYRGRGYGGALTARVVLDGLAGGADMALLTSSQLGENLYRSLGFREVGRWAQWLPVDADDG